MTHHYALLFTDGSLTVFTSACTADEAIQQCALENAALANSSDRARACQIDIASMRIVKPRRDSRRNRRVLTVDVVTAHREYDQDERQRAGESVPPMR